ncbi:hypothetical protein [Chamaesiphon sp. VAR_48_metabat_403]|uniref:hypothetical protein n=1 Tax=Chamaesiphon sp. VAR_48_metabat_403 TaxID=2964700 RepID=UPI00286E0C96|nr:hypothetical protein [Chamaesiphon sp. VAR_48_metabat_403]
MNFFTKIGSIGLILALAIGSTQSVFAQGNELPKIGAVKNAPSGAGCSFSLAGSKSTAPIFVNIAGEVTLMNFDGKDTKLTRVGNRSDRPHAPENYTAKNLKIKLAFRPTKKIDYTQLYDVQITISNGNKTQAIKASGGCGC